MAVVADPGFDLACEGMGSTGTVALLEFGSVARG